MADRAEQQLVDATRKVADARADLVKAMRRARAAGMTYREIGELTNLSHQTIWRMIRDE